MNRLQLNFSILLIISFVIAGVFTNEVYGQPTENDEKWRRVALQEVKRQFPETKVTEYEYVKKKKINEEKVKDIFKIQGSQQQDSPFIAFVTVTFNPVTNQLMAIEIEKKT